MSLDYTSVPGATQAPSPAPAQDALPIARLPADGDALNVASIYQVLKMLTDGQGWSFANAVHKAVARTITGILTFTTAPLFSVSGDDNPDLDFSGAPTNYKQTLRLPVGVTERARLYRAASQWVITVNAVWRNATTDWARDVAGDALKVSIARDALAIYKRASGDASPWADGSWTQIASINATGLAIGAVAATNDIASSAGHLLAPAGHVRAKRLRSAGTALASGDFALAGWGETGGKSAFGGSDTAWTVTATAGGGGESNPATVVLTFKDGTYTDVPIVGVSIAGFTPGAGSAGQLPMSWTRTATTVTITLTGLLVDGDVYIFAGNTFGH